MTGLSRPYLALSASIVAWLGLRSDSQGLPGTAFIRKKVRHMTMNRVSTAIRTRFITYFPISTLPIG